MKKIVAFVLSMIICFNMNLTAMAAETDNPITVEYVLQQLEEGKATETFEVIELSELSMEEIQNEPILYLTAQEIQAREIGITPRMGYQQTINGTCYVHTITTITGATLKYSLCPKMFLEWGDIPQNGNVLWRTKFYVISKVTLDGVEQTGYTNTGKIKNVSVAVGVGPYARFSDKAEIYEEYETGSQNDVLGLFAALLDLGNYSTASAITSLLAALPITSTTEKSQMTFTGGSQNLLKVQYSSDVVLRDTDDNVVLDFYLFTPGTATEEDTTCYFSVVWTFDVYNYTAITYSGHQLTRGGSVLTNAV